MLLALQYQTCTVSLETSWNLKHLYIYNHLHRVVPCGYVCLICCHNISGSMNQSSHSNGKGENHWKIIDQISAGRRKQRSTTWNIGETNQWWLDWGLNRRHNLPCVFFCGTYPKYPQTGWLWWLWRPTTTVVYIQLVYIHEHFRSF